MHRPTVHDVVTPTEREARLADVDARMRRYLLTVLPALALVMGALLVPAPRVLRLCALLAGLLLAPFALGATLPGRGPGPRL